MRQLRDFCACMCHRHSVVYCGVVPCCDGPKGPRESAEKIIERVIAEAERKRNAERGAKRK